MNHASYTHNYFAPHGVTISPCLDEQKLRFEVIYFHQ
jgi:hypothetical protein